MENKEGWGWHGQQKVRNKMHSCRKKHVIWDDISNTILNTRKRESGGK